jgi:hypothetical protein
MKKTYPHVYKIHPGEQLSRLGQIGAAAAGSTHDWRSPFYLSLWYGGMMWGYLRGPAWVDREAGAR